MVSGVIRESALRGYLLEEAPRLLVCRVHRSGPCPGITRYRPASSPGVPGHGRPTKVRAVYDCV